ncbi:MAG: 30S ribosome-binding factor RbfA, partial [Bacteroidales bacterium]|nr:30S ribosome-binding factor RbfA [Bacteroidales bacterium]
NKVARLIQKEIATVFQIEANSLFPGKMITVTVVRVSPDLSIAKVYLSVFPFKPEEKYIEYINEQSKHLRNGLAKKIKNQLRIVPELVFYRDDSIDYANRIDDLLNENKEEEE